MDFAETSLPFFLLTAWRLSPDSFTEAKQRDELKGWTVSNLASACLKFQLEQYEKLQEQRQGSRSRFTHTLTALATKKILDLLKSSNGLYADVRSLVERIDGGTLRLLLKDPRTPYVILRLLDHFSPRCISNAKRRIVDIDEAILASETFVSSGYRDDKNQYLVTLQDLCTVFGPLGPSGKLVLTRKTPPKGGFEFLDEKRPSTVCIHASDSDFSETFDVITNGILRGLDWNNVFVAGGMALEALLHTDTSRDASEEFSNSSSESSEERGSSTDDTNKASDCDIDIYLYDLTPEQANAKIDHIHRVWKSNLPASNNETSILKTSKTITFFAEWPNRRVQIVLKLLHSPLDILLNFDLDPCAIGFDGERVWMMPRCARALETGYSVFTMSLVWGHYLSNRRETHEKRVFKYANRGFGLRILPSYIKTLEHNRLESNTPGLQTADYDQRDLETIDETLRRNYGGETVVQYEPGLKLLRRVAHLAKMFVQSFCFDEIPCRAGTVEWERAQQNSSKEKKNFRIRDIDTHVADQIFSQDEHFDVFEIFMRHCEAWRLDALGIINLRLDAGYDVSYESDTYDTLPGHLWGAGSSLALLSDYVSDWNNRLFRSLRMVIETRLRTRGSYRSYLTRRIRNMIEGSDLASVQAKQITNPLVIPLEIQNHITQDIPLRYPDASDFLGNVLIPVHDPSNYQATGTPGLPSLQETSSEVGNPRYWLITNESMWSNQHRALDEVAELLSALFSWVRKGDDPGSKNDDSYYSTDNEHCIWHLASTLRRRIVLPELEIEVPRIESSSVNSNRSIGPVPLREALLFRSWIAQRPLSISGEPDWYEFWGSIERGVEERLDSIWEEGDEGNWDEEGVPVWT